MKLASTGFNSIDSSFALWGGDSFYFQFLGNLQGLHLLTVQSCWCHLIVVPCSQSLGLDANFSSLPGLLCFPWKLSLFLILPAFFLWVPYIPHFQPKIDKEGGVQQYCPLKVYFYQQFICMFYKSDSGMMMMMAGIYWFYLLSTWNHSNPKPLGNIYNSYMTRYSWTPKYVWMGINQRTNLYAVVSAQGR